MEEGLEKIEDKEKTARTEIFSKAVRAGKRTYFFDVKATRRNDYYLTLTESKKRFNKEGRYFFEKHKLFLYKEDFEKFTDALQEVIEFIKEQKADQVEDTRPMEEEVNEPEPSLAGSYTDVEFEDLEGKNE